MEFILSSVDFFTCNYWVGWVDQNNSEWNSIIDNVGYNSFSSLLSTFSGVVKYFSGKDGSAAS